LFAATNRSQRLLRAAFEGAPMTTDEYGVYSLLGFRGPIAPANCSVKSYLPVSPVESTTWPMA